MSSIFLSAKWEKLILANYEIDPAILMPYVPPKTELDLYNNKCLVSLVGFHFTNTKVKGLSIPFHKNFEEVNLRFYVKYKYQNTWRRGTVFIKEIVPRLAISLVANYIYNEHYVRHKMSHAFQFLLNSQKINYRWLQNQNWNTMEIESELIGNPLLEGSEEEFITEHYWGYTKLNNKTSAEYAVEHPRWKTYSTINYLIDVDFQAVYGNSFKFLKQSTPISVFLAEGSEVIVKTRTII